MWDSGTTGCHGWVESNRDKARELGYLIQKIESAQEIPFSRQRWVVVVFRQRRWKETT
jgi:hypothetical protein